MKWNAIIIIVLGLVIIGAVALIVLNLPSSGPAAGPGNYTPSTSAPTLVPKPTKADVLEKFSLLRDKVNSSGKGYGGGAVQLVDGEETALVYVYKPSSASDISDLLAAGFSSVYSVFNTKDPLMVGIVDTSQKVNPTTFKVDIYALERPVVEDYLKGAVTNAELANLVLLVTPQTESLHPNNSTHVKKSINLAYNNSSSYMPPSDRLGYFYDSINQSGFSRPLSLQAGPLSTGEKAVNVVMSLPRNATDADKYGEMKAALRACAGSYGDYDRYMISLLPLQDSVSDYYFIDTPPAPVLAYFNGDINEYQLFNTMNLTYYTK